MNSTTYIVTNFLAFLLGQWLVTRNHWSGFLVWCAANAYSIVICVLTDMPQTSFLFATYFFVNFASLRSWFVKSRCAPRNEAGRGPSVAIQKLLQARVAAVHLASRRVPSGTEPTAAVTRA